MGLDFNRLLRRLAFVLLCSVSFFGMTTKSMAAVTTPAPIPANQVNLSDYGGVPGASSAAIVNAFNQAFVRLKLLGGGTLNISPGVYNVGVAANAGDYLINVSDLSNVLISGYGAQLQMTTIAASGTPVLLGFQNPSNVTVAGLSFTDFGTNLNINWKGAVAISVDTSRAVSKFKTVDIVADNVVTMFRSFPPVPYSGTEFDIHGTVRNAYYGVNSNYTGRFSKANITAHNVRRAFISYGARDWDVTVKGSADGTALGSNAYVEMVPEPGYPVENINVNLTMSGSAANYFGGLIHIYHQGPTTVSQYARNVRAHVVLNNLAAPPTSIFFFTHEPPGVGAYIPSTPRTFENITLSAQVIGNFTGTMIRNPSFSTGSTNSINVGQSIANYQNIAALPYYFKVIPDPQPPTPNPAPTSGPAPVVSLAVQGAPNLPLNGTSTPVTVGLVTGTPLRVELSRDGFAPFAIWPDGPFFALSSDGKSLKGDWCISNSCWGGVAGAHVLNVVATYADGRTASAAVQLNVADSVPASQPAPVPASAPAISLAVQGGPNLPLNGTLTPVTVGFATGTPLRVEMSRDGYPAFATWPDGSFFTLSSDGKSLKGNWCISNSCWGGIAGAHVLNVKATYADGKTASASVKLNVVDVVVGTRIDMTKVQPELGYAYIIVHNFGTPADTPIAPYQSKLMIYENGKALGGAHTLHANIRNSGKGVFSHWGEGAGQSLRFSSSDNTDPRANGRTYSYRILP